MSRNKNRSATNIILHMKFKRQ